MTFTQETTWTFSDASVDYSIVAAVNVLVDDPANVGPDFQIDHTATVTVHDPVVYVFTGNEDSWANSILREVEFEGEIKITETELVESFEILSSYFISSSSTFTVTWIPEVAYSGITLYTADSVGYSQKLDIIETAVLYA